MVDEPQGDIYGGTVAAPGVPGDHELRADLPADCAVGLNRDSLLGCPTVPTDRTRARLAAARERIVDAALDQLAEGGYASASVATVARRAGVATGTVYRHFPSKADLFAEVFRRAAQREVDVLRAMTDREEPRRAPAGRLGRGVRAPRARRAGPRVRADRRAGRPGGRGRAADLPARLRRPVRARARSDGVQRGELPPLDAASSPPPRSSARWPRRSSARSSAATQAADALVAGLQTFVLRSVGMRA